MVYIFISSPKPKAQVSFSDQNLSVVRRRCCCRRHRRRRRLCRKLFTFSSSSPESLDKFQPNLVQIIQGCRKFKLEGSPFFLREIITK